MRSSRETKTKPVRRSSSVIAALIDRQCYRVTSDSDPRLSISGLIIIMWRLRGAVLLLAGAFLESTLGQRVGELFSGKTGSESIMSNKSLRSSLLASVDTAKRVHYLDSVRFHLFHLDRSISKSSSG